MTILLPIIGAIIGFTPFILWMYAENKWGKKTRIFWGIVCQGFLVFILIFTAYGMYGGLVCITAFHHATINAIKSELEEKHVQKVIIAIDQYQKDIYEKKIPERHALLDFLNTLLSQSNENVQTENEDMEIERLSH